MPRWYRSLGRRCGALACFLLIGGVPAFGQSSEQPAPEQSTPPRKPKASSPGVFGGTSPRTGEPTSGLLVSMTQAYDDNVLAEGGTPIQSSLQAGGLYTDLNANLMLHLARRRVQFSSAAGTDFRYYQQQHTTLGIGHYGNSGLTYTSTRTTFSVAGGAAYAPSYLYRLFATVAAAQLVGDTAVSNFAITDTSSYNYDARIELTENITPRSRITVRGGGRYTDYLHTQPQINGFGSRDLASYETGASYARGISRNANLNFGYTYRRAQYYTGVFPTEHDFTFGLDYAHPISKTRKALYHVAASTVMLDAPAPGDGSGLLRRQYKAAVDASVGRQFARTWQASGAYRRGVGFIEGFATPVLTDGISLNTTGLLSRRVDFLANASYSVGEPVVAGDSSGFTTYAGDVRIRLALGPEWAIYGEYLYYNYDFSQGFVPVGLPPRMSRNTVRAGFTLWAPLGGR